jgi:DNA polymerase-1
MDDMAEEYLRYKTVSYSDLTGTGKDQKDIREVPLDQLSDYSCEDSDITFRLYETLNPLLKEKGFSDLCAAMEFPLVGTLARMEESGIAINSEYLTDMSKEMERQIDQLTLDIHHAAGESFNINSTQQLAEILFQKLQLPSVRKTKTGFSTDVAVLEALQGKHPIVDRLLEYRQLSKLKSTYIDALPRLVHPVSHRVHTSFNQTVTTTGRLSSSNPNLQNIPIRTEIGRSIRKAFIAGRPDSVLLAADYSQIELRVMAHVSDDPGLKEAFQNHEDIHASTAAKVFGIPQKDITRDMRRKAKEVNFGIMYGIGPYGLASRLEMTQTEAKEIIARYFERFPNVRRYIDETIAQAKKDGYVSTLCGRRRYIPDINSKNHTIRQNAERQAINMPIQGTAADMIKLAMVRLDAELTRQAFHAAMILQVHDELVLEVPTKEVESLRPLVQTTMCEALPLSVPIEVEIGVGDNWLDAH